MSARNDLLEPRSCHPEDFLGKGGIFLGHCDLHLLLARGLSELLDGIHNLYDPLVSKGNRLYDRAFGNLVGLSLHHDDGISCADNQQIQGAVLQLGHGRVNDELTVYKPDPCTPTGPMKGMLDICNAADAPLTAMTSGVQAGSAESTMAMIWSSL